MMKIHLTNLSIENLTISHRLVDKDFMNCDGLDHLLSLHTNLLFIFDNMCAVSSPVGELSDTSLALIADNEYCFSCLIWTNFIILDPKPKLGTT